MLVEERRAGVEGQERGGEREGRQGVVREVGVAACQLERWPGEVVVGVDELAQFVGEAGDGEWFAGVGLVVTV